MNAADMTRMDEASLKKQIDDLYHELFNLRFQRAAGQLKNPSRLSQVRRDIARAKTVARARQIATKESAG